MNRIRAQSPPELLRAEDVQSEFQRFWTDTLQAELIVQLDALGSRIEAGISSALSKGVSTRERPAVKLIQSKTSAEELREHSADKVLSKREEEVLSEVLSEVQSETERETRRPIVSQWLLDLQRESGTIETEQHRAAADEVTNRANQTGADMSYGAAFAKLSLARRTYLKGKTDDTAAEPMTRRSSIRRGSTAKRHIFLLVDLASQGTVLLTTALAGQSLL
eukprot:gnl/TRDRNA2_/TRDRNA2_212093_c0_seq1.p1 gnl/TRDRNA2_/TRDRNA2_212093_c0~~gnl/TRDRNA2_/TRDRNA2_212093_c0_seq1.p1  ORF type:complete len:221 (-),score=20.19 gnl/TRDRNA2_/TRDRNA2_212093_c0_seq1:86-748(-)